MDPNGAAEIIQASGAVAAASRLIYLNLARQFPALLAFLAFLAGLDLSLGLQEQSSVGYFWTYITLEPVEWIFGVMAVRELLTLTFRDYPGIRTAGRWTMYGAVVFWLSVSMFLTEFFWSRGAAGRANSHSVYYVEIAKRSIVFSLAGVIVVILIFLSRYPLRLSRNFLVSSLFFSALFLSEATRLLLDSFTRKTVQAIDWAQEGFIFLCLVGWTIFLRRDKPETAPQIRYSMVREDHLLRELNALNALMSRAARR